jgi:hypothetical protein
VSARVLDAARTALVVVDVQEAFRPAVLDFARDPFLADAPVLPFGLDRELERCANAGLRGALLWQVPHPDLPFTSDHYASFWDAAQALQMPVSLHILTGFGYSRRGGATPQSSRVEAIWNSVNLKQLEASRAIFDLIFFGVLDRYPRLQFVLVENEIGWIPFNVEQWDYYYTRFGERLPGLHRPVGADAVRPVPQHRLAPLPQHPHGIAEAAQFPLGVELGRILRHVPSSGFASAAIRARRRKSKGRSAPGPRQRRPASRRKTL